MNIFKRYDNVLQTEGEVIRNFTWAYDLGCCLVGMGIGFRHNVLELAELQPGEQVLDVGCGTGVMTRLATDIVGSEGKVIGVDPSNEMIQVAKQGAAKAQSNAEFQTGVIESLPFKDEHFDLVLSSMMFHHLPPELKKSGLEEMYRVLKPGGRLMIVDFGKPSSLLARWLLFPWRNDIMVKDNLEGRITEFIQNAGFLNVHHPRRQWHRFISYWLATKPEK